MKKIIDRIHADRFCRALLLALFVLGLFFPVKNVSAEVISGKCGDHATWEINRDSGRMTISGSGAMWDYFDPDETPYYGHAHEVSSLNIQNGITKIGDCAFSYFDIKSVNIPSSVTMIGKEAFFHSSLNSISIPSSVQTIGNDAFSYCESLKKLTLANGLKTIGEYAFAVTPLSSVTIPKSVTFIDKYAFRCKISTLKTVYMKGRKTLIDTDVFGGNQTSTNANLILYGYKGSTAEKFAKENKMGFRTFGVKIPSKPKITSLSRNKTRAKTKLKFKKVSGAYQYEIQIAKSKDFHGKVLQAFVKNTALNLKGISSSYTKKTVYVRVRAYKKTAGKISVSNWSKVKKTKMKK